MPTKRLLVDAIHPEETRIVVTSGNRLEEFDFESASRRQLRGNIYLAKVTRVEPSLQAAFVEYGGNRHGFLAFSEIHPDYYQIPVSDREALLADQEREEQAEDEVEEPSAKAQAHAEDEADDNGDHSEDSPASDETVDDVGGGEDALEEVPERKRAQPRKYKIQEVIKRRQVMLVQVVKEERGNKGAALTTYLSLAGRYSVLMPNTARGGGISRKITNAADRKRLKEIAGDLEVPQGMGVILRTAGASRTKAEVKRDFEYLLRLWENVRNLTLKSQAPCLVYEEGSLIKRTIRDLYNKDINEVFVAGDAAYREAKDFMRMIMPSHAKNVQQYRDDQPIFSKYSVENQLDSMFSPQVTLPSGGYIVINPTEALVSIDVNSGRATREHNIEDTALQTNLEAADEVARQLRLRDLAGLIVIDFIDMMEKRSVRNVERRLKDALKDDRARIQVGRISHFGLLEMSRQRIRFGVLESSTHVCPTCAGAGIVRSTESIALMVMRAVEDHVLRKPGQSINVRVPTDVALYILNAKRGTLSELEAKYGLSITISADSKVEGNHFQIERGETRALPAGDVTTRHVSVDSAQMVDADEDEDEASGEETGSDTDQPRGKRRRRRRGGRDRQDNEPSRAQDQSDDTDSEDDEDQDEPARAQASGEDDDMPRKRRRRGRRGGRRNRRSNGEDQSNDQPSEAEASGAPASDARAQDVVEGSEPKEPREAVVEPVGDLDTNPDPTAKAADEPATEEKPKKPRRSRRKKADAETDAAPAEAAAQAAPAESVAQPTPENSSEPAPETKSQPDAAEENSTSRRSKKELPPEGVVVTSSSAPEDEEKKPKKAGWWQRGFLG